MLIDNVFRLRSLISGSMNLLFHKEQAVFPSIISMSDIGFLRYLFPYVSCLEQHLMIIFPSVLFTCYHMFVMWSIIGVILRTHNAVD